MQRRKTNPFLIGLLLAGASTAMCLAQTPSAFTSSGDMQSARIGHTTTLLNDGRVLIAGGIGGAGVLATAELFDPATGAFTPLPAMTTPRQAHSATLLSDGRVLIAGGLSGQTRNSQLVSAELFDPVAGTFTQTADLNATHSQHTATRLSDGTVLICGGNPDGSLEYYDPSMGTFIPVSGPGFNPSDAVLLATGSVFLAGFADAQILDPTKDSLAPAGRTADMLNYPAATLLFNGKVLLTGNAGNLDIGQGCPSPCVSSQLYDPVAAAFSRTAPPWMPHFDHTATLLTDGTVLVAGGVSPTDGIPPAEVYDPVQDVYRPAGAMVSERVGFSSTLLADGRVFITGGSVPGGGQPFNALASTEIYTPSQRVPPPVLLSLSGDGTGPGAILHADSHLPVSDDLPAAIGEPLEIYVTGLADGGAVPPFVAIGGQAARVLWFGSSPVYRGLNQINIRVPAGIATDAPVSVRLNYLGRPSNQVTLSVK